MIKHLFKGGKSKALTLSYDDGVQFDKRLVDIFDKYNLKATFNVNSGVEPGSTWVNNGVDVTRMDLKDTLDLYKNHEIAAHSFTHPYLTQLTKEEIVFEIVEDRKNLEAIYGGVITGMAYPFGTYNDTVLEVLSEVGIEYCRTVKSHESFSIPDDFLQWHPTCHHRNPKLMEIARKFLDDKSDELKLFYVWGHSYEFQVDNNWEVIEGFAKEVAEKEDIWYATNIEIYEYINALKQLKYSVDKLNIYNPTAFDLWININEKVVKIEAGELKKI